MTEEILQAIHSAEEQAAQIKAAAIEKAEKLLLDAEAKTQEIERASFDECKALLETAQTASKIDAQSKYDEMITNKTKEAKTYCAEALKRADSLVSEIVRRLVSGDC